MKNYLLLAASLLVLSCSKKETEMQTQTPEKETVYIEQATEQNLNDSTEISQNDSVAGHQESETAKSGISKDLSGKHSLTLQWISWEKPGIINFKKIGENKYQVSGGQKRGADYLKIEGNITQISDEELAFEGTVETNIQSNGGKCLRTGPQTFLVTQNRKYWRMQNMVECFGLTDYVDIYF